MRLEPKVCLGNHQNRCDGDGYCMLCDFHIGWTCACMKDDMLWESADAVRRAGGLCDDADCDRGDGRGGAPMSLRQWLRHDVRG